MFHACHAHAAVPTGLMQSLSDKSRKGWAARRAAGKGAPIKSLPKEGELSGDLFRTGAPSSLLLAVSIHYMVHI